MVKFDDSGRADYKQLEGLIIYMISNRLDSETPNARLTEGQSYASYSTSSSQAQSPVSFSDLKYVETSHQPFPPPAVNNYFYVPYSASQSSIGDQPVHEEQKYQGGGRQQNQSHWPFNARDTPSRQKTAPVNGAQQRLYESLQDSLPRNSSSDSKVPLANTREYPSGPRHSKTDSQKKPLNSDDDLLNRLKLFDTVFIIDDTGSMGLPVRDDDDDGPTRWEVTKDALKHIAKIAARYDEDGIDIRFLIAEKLNETNIRSGERVEEILTNIDVTDEHHGGGTYFRNQLRAVIRGRLNRYEDYVEELAEFDKKSKGREGMRADPEELKFLNMIVITDGQADDEEEVEEYIVKVAKDLDKMEAPSNYIGIQFIQIGDDEKATSFLQRLDDELKTQRNIWDVSFPFNPIFSSSERRNLADKSLVPTDCGHDALFMQCLFQSSRGI